MGSFFLSCTHKYTCIKMKIVFSGLLFLLLITIVEQVESGKCNCKMVQNVWTDDRLGINFEVNNCAGSCTGACRGKKWNKRKEVTVDHRLQHFLTLDKFMKYSCEPVKQVMQSAMPKGSNKPIHYVKVTECGCVLQWKVPEEKN